MEQRASLVTPSTADLAGATAPRLVAVSGLPGVGKSAVAEGVGRALGVPVLSVDPVESALHRAGVDPDQPTGLAAYAVVQALAAENLRLGTTVVVDAVNDDPRARAAWQDVAGRTGAVLRFVEVVCPDEDLHRARLAGRRRDLAFPEPTWASVQARRDAFRTWRGERLVLDARAPVADLVARVVADLGDDAGRRGA